VWNSYLKNESSSHNTTDISDWQIITNIFEEFGNRHPRLRAHAPTNPNHFIDFILLNNTFIRISHIPAFHRNPGISRPAVSEMDRNVHWLVKNPVGTPNNALLFHRNNNLKSCIFFKKTCRSHFCWLTFDPQLIYQ